MKPVLLTFADKANLHLAKQLFGSVFANNAWDAEFAVITINLTPEEESWFKKRNIQVHPFKKKNVSEQTARMFAKFEIFAKSFYIYDIIIFINPSSMIKGNLDLLGNIGWYSTEHTFSAVNNWGKSLQQIIATQGYRIRNGMSRKKSSAIIKKLKKEYNLETKTFDSEVFVVRPNLLHEDFHKKITQLAKTYGPLDELEGGFIFNLAFYNAWMKLSPIYNIPFIGDKNPLRLRPGAFEAIIIRFNDAEKTCCDPKNYFFNEWTNNLEKAELFDATKARLVTTWTPEKIASYTRSLFNQKSFHNNVQKAKISMKKSLKQINAKIFTKLFGK